jgi:SEC-C motif
MSNETGRNEPCECGSGKKHMECCGAPQGEVTTVQVKDLSVFELTPGLADALSASTPAFDSRDALTFRVGKDGRCQTTSLMVYSVPTKYEFFYDTPAGLQPVRDDFVDHAIDAGGITARSDDPHYGTAWYFFVGPKDYRNQHPPSEFTSNSSPLPTPGPMSLRKP